MFTHPLKNWCQDAFLCAFSVCVYKARCGKKKGLKKYIYILLTVSRYVGVVYFFLGIIYKQCINRKTNLEIFFFSGENKNICAVRMKTYSFHFVILLFEVQVSVLFLILYTFFLHLIQNSVGYFSFIFTSRHSF